MREGLDVEDLLHRVKLGEISEQEVGKVAEALTGDPGSDSYRLLYIIVRAGARQYEDLVARFIDYSLDPQVAALALSSLCVQWGLSDKYRDRIVRGLVGVDWDSFDELKHAAISAAGEYLRTNSDRVVLEQLIRMAVSPGDGLSARFAVEALARALGEPHSTAVYPKGTDGQGWAQSVLERAMDRLTAEDQ